MWPRGLIGFSSGWTICWPAVEAAAGPSTFSASVLPVTVMQRRRAALFRADTSSRPAMPPTLCRSSMTYLPLGLRSASSGDAVADLLEVVDRERHVDRAGHGDQVQHGVGRAAERRSISAIAFSNACAGHDVARLEVVLEQMPDRLRRREAFVELSADLRRASRSCRAATCPALRWPRPSCWRCTCRRRRRRRGRTWRTISLPLALR